MDRETFKNRLELASESALRLAREFTYNEIAENLNYRINPNSLDLSDHLTDIEKENLNCRKREINKNFKIDEVIDRLTIEDKVPIWINCSVIRSTRKFTTIELFTSRRFRTDSDLYHKSENYPPFHAVISLPPYTPIDSKEKFDLNWRFKKIQTAIKLFKAKNDLKAEIKKKRESGKDYWYNFDQFCDNLTKRNRVDLVDELRNAKKCVNGLTDGWYDFKNQLYFIHESYNAELTKNELVDFEYLRNEIERILKS